MDYQDIDALSINGIYAAMEKVKKALAENENKTNSTVAEIASPSVAPEKGQKKAPKKVPPKVRLEQLTKERTRLNAKMTELKKALAEREAEYGDACETCGWKWDEDTPPDAAVSVPKVYICGACGIEREAGCTDACEECDCDKPPVPVTDTPAMCEDCTCGGCGDRKKFCGGC